MSKLTDIIPFDTSSDRFKQISLTLLCGSLYYLIQRLFPRNYVSAFFNKYIKQKSEVEHSKWINMISSLLMLGGMTAITSTLLWRYK